MKLKDKILGNKILFYAPDTEGWTVGRIIDTSDYDIVRISYHLSGVLKRDWINYKQIRSIYPQPL